MKEVRDFCLRIGLTKDDAWENREITIMCPSCWVRALKDWPFSQRGFTWMLPSEEEAIRVRFCRACMTGGICMGLIRMRMRSITSLRMAVLPLCVVTSVICIISCAIMVCRERWTAFWLIWVSLRIILMIRHAVSRFGLRVRWTCV